MNEDIKTEWINRLEDGRPQGRALLQNDRGQCCLGVLCEMAAEAGVVEVIVNEDVTDKRVGYYDEVLGAYEYHVLPLAVAKWAGLSLEDGFNAVPIRPRSNAFRDGRIYTLTELNDEGYKFSEIAKVIREEL